MALKLLLSHVLHNPEPSLPRLNMPAKNVRPDTEVVPVPVHVHANTNIPDISRLARRKAKVRSIVRRIETRTNRDDKSQEVVHVITIVTVVVVVPDHDHVIVATQIQAITTPRREDTRHQQVETNQAVHIRRLTPLLTNNNNSGEGLGVQQRQSDIRVGLPVLKTTKTLKR